MLQLTVERGCRRDVGRYQFDGVLPAALSPRASSAAALSCRLALDVFLFNLLRRSCSSSALRDLAAASPGVRRTGSAPSASLGQASLSSVASSSPSAPTFAVLAKWHAWSTVFPLMLPQRVHGWSQHSVQISALQLHILHCPTEDRPTLQRAQRQASSKGTCDPSASICTHSHGNCPRCHIAISLSTSPQGVLSKPAGKSARMQPLSWQP